MKYLQTRFWKLIGKVSVVALTKDAPENVQTKAIVVTIEEPGNLTEMLVSELAQQFINEDTHYKYGAQFTNHYLEHIKHKALVDAMYKYPFLTASIYTHLTNEGYK